MDNIHHSLCYDDNKLFILLILSLLIGEYHGVTQSSIRLYFVDLNVDSVILHSFRDAAVIALSDGFHP